MSATIAPALPPDVWERILAAPPEITIESSTQGESDVSVIPVTRPHQRHAMAAIALYGQPFGFTREDVRFLREDAETHRMEPEDWHADVPILLSLAARIEALLPPETS